MIYTRTSLCRPSQSSLPPPSGRVCHAHTACAQSVCHSSDTKWGPHFSSKSWTCRALTWSKTWGSSVIFTQLDSRFDIINAMDRSDPRTWLTWAVLRLSSFILTVSVDYFIGAQIQFICNTHNFVAVLDAINFMFVFDFFNCNKFVSHIDLRKKHVKITCQDLAIVWNIIVALHSYTSEIEKCIWNVVDLLWFNVCTIE